jgi:hypothetical protein
MRERIGDKRFQGGLSPRNVQEESPAAPWSAIFDDKNLLERLKRRPDRLGAPS